MYCVIKTFKLSSENEYAPEYIIQPADTMISNWMTLPTLATQKIDNRNVRISFTLFVGTNHTPISGLKTGLDTLNY